MDSQHFSLAVCPRGGLNLEKHLFSLFLPQLPAGTPENLIWVEAEDFHGPFRLFLAQIDEDVRPLRAAILQRIVDPQHTVFVGLPDGTFQDRNTES